MSTVAKVFVVLNLLLAVAFLGAAATLLGNTDSYKKTLASERDQTKLTLAEKDKLYNDKVSDNATLTRQKNEASDRANIARTEADLRKSQNDQLITDINKLSAAYASATKALEVAQSTIRDGRALVDNLQTERQQLITLKTAAEEQANAAVKAQNAAELNLENAQAALQDANAKLASTTQELERATFKLESVERRMPGAAVPTSAQPAQQGKVLQIDNDKGIVIISLGSEDGVKVGFKYTVSRGSHYVGSVTVSDVQAKMATARVVPGLSADKIQINDNIMNAQ